LPIEGTIDWISGSESSMVKEDLAFGPRSGWVDISYHHGASFLLVNMQLGGLSRFIGRLAEETVNTCVPLSLLGLGALYRVSEIALHGLFTAMAGSCVGDADIRAIASPCFATVDQFFYDCLFKMQEISSEAFLLSTGLYAADHPAKIDVLTRELDLTKNYFAKSIRAATSLCPKEFLGISRAKRLYEHLIENKKSYNGSWIAQEFGYYDQAHAVHDISARTGFTPSAIHKFFIPKEADEVWYGYRQGVK